jgi:hypothetical protein
MAALCYNIANLFYSMKQVCIMANIRKARCRRGHEYTKENTYYWNGNRACRTCRALHTPGTVRRQNYARYGLTEQDVQAMFEQQRGLCACCGNPETSTIKSTGQIKMLHIDHNHKTGEVRGLLCQDCNMSLGHLQDSSQRIQMLLDYAKAHGL